MNLHKAYGENQVLTGIDLEIQKGEVISVIGPSGTGKSTLLRCINYLEKADKGVIIFDDTRYDLESITHDEIYSLRKHSSMVFQTYNLFLHMTVLENVLANLIYVKKYNKNDAKKIAMELLVKVGLEDKINSYPRHLSGGQQQRAGIARAMAVNPDIILFDEPTSSLDPELVSEVLTVIKELASNKQTMLIVTHEMQFARNVSDKVIFMEGGKILESGTPSEVFDQSKNNRLNAFLNKMN